MKRFLIILGSFPRFGEYLREKFNAGVTFGFSVTVKDETTVTLKLFIDGNEHHSLDVSRVADEIPSDNAKAVVKISEFVNKLVLIKG